VVKINYFVDEIVFSRKAQKVKYIFRRIPTKEQLEKHAAQQKNKPKPKHEFNLMPHFAMLSYVIEGNEEELEMNFPVVQVIVTLQEATDKDLKIAQVVQLDVPEETKDIVLVEAQ